VLCELVDHLLLAAGTSIATPRSRWPRARRGAPERRSAEALGMSGLIARLDAG
jgi:hypothetical protein